MVVRAVDQTQTSKQEKMSSTDTLYTTKPIIPAYVDFPTLRTSNPRLWLRSFQESDLHVFYEIRQQIEVMRWTSKAKIDANMEETRTWMKRFLQVEEAIPVSTAAETKDDTIKSNDDQTATVATHVANALSGSPYYGFVVLYDDEDGSSRIVGTIGMLNLNMEPAIGYMFHKDEWGKGFATVTAQALLENWYQLERQVVAVPDERIERVKKILTLTGESFSSGDGVSKESPIPEILHAVTEGTNAASGKVLTKIGFTLEREFTEIEEGVEVPLKSYVRVQRVSPAGHQS